MVNKDYQIILTNVVTHLFFDALDDLSGGSDVTVAWHTTGYVHDANDQPTNQSINQSISDAAAAGGDDNDDEHVERLLFAEAAALASEWASATDGDI